MSQEQVTPRRFTLDWPNDTAEARGIAIQSLLESDSWAWLLDALEQYKRHEFRILLSSPPAGDPAEYERKLGELNGLELLPQVAAGVVENGREAASKLRAA